MDQHILVTKWVDKLLRKKVFIWLKNSKKKKFIRKYCFVKPEIFQQNISQ